MKIEPGALFGFRIAGAIAALAAAFASPHRAAAEPELAPRKKGLVVHEWGVLGVGHSAGGQVLGSTDRYLESLPEFVLRNDRVAPVEFVEQKPSIVFKPVIHFYGEEGQKLRVTIKFPKGYPIVYYPKPKLTMHTVNAILERGKFGTVTRAQAMTWQFKLTKEDPKTLVTAPADHWWNAARQIAGDFLIMDDPEAGAERFLFYEGTTYENPTISAKVTEEAITVVNSATPDSAPVVLILNDNGSFSGRYLETVNAGGEVRLSRKDLEHWDKETLLSKCRKQWEACGMTPEEAGGIVECWKPELLGTHGFLLISKIPDPVYETIFPLTIDPKPAELTRACLVFDTLAGANGRKHWLPSLSKLGRGTIDDLAANDFKQRLIARAKLIGWGEVMTPFVDEVLATPEEVADPQLRMAALTVKGILTESPVCAHPLPQVVPGQRVGKGWSLPFEDPPAILRGPDLIKDLRVIEGLPR